MMSHMDDISVDRFEKILEGTSKISNLEHGFQSYIKKVLVSQAVPKANVLDTMKSILLTVPKDNLHCYLNLYLSHVSHQKNLHWVRCLLEMLMVLVKEGKIPAKPVCDAAVKVLDIRNEMICCQILMLIKSIIGSVDYKGCRDLLISLLDNIDGLPLELPLTCRKALATVQQTVSYILDRNASVLPAYVAGIELQKRYHHIQKGKAHWVICEEVDRCIESLKGIANMVSGGGYVLLFPVVGVSSLHGLSWRLNSDTLALPLKGLLPYKKVYLEPHIGLLRHLMFQPQSWDLLWTVGGFTKQQKNPQVEELLADLAILCMRVSEAGHDPEFESNTREFHMWNHFSAQLLQFCFFHFINFGPIMVHILDKLLQLNLTKGRDYLMWSIYQYLSSNSQTNAQINFFRDYPPLINLMDLLYADKEPLAVPDVTKRSSVYKLAASSLWVYVARKASNEKRYLPRPTPFVLQPQVDYLNKMVQAPPMITNFSAVLFCNAFSPAYDLGNNTLALFTERCCGPAGGLSSLMEPCFTIGSTVPLPLTILESFTAYAKFSLITKLRQFIVKAAETPSSAETLKQCLPPALLECYGRFLSFPEVEWIGFKTFLTNVIYPVVKVRSWHTFNGLLELVSFRVHQHIPQSYRFKLIGNFLNVASFGNVPNQLYISIETATLRLIARASTTDLHIQIAQFSNDPKQLLSQDSEECNRALVLMVAHTLHITGVESTADNWLECFIKNAYNSTPHKWSTATLAHFPSSVQHCYSTVASSYYPADIKRMLITRVEEESRKWRGSINEADLMRSYQETDAGKYCLCVLWRGYMETGQINPVLIRVLERLQAKSMASQLRLLADYFVYEMSTNQQLLNTAVHKLSDLVWKYNLFTLDRLILTMTMRWFDNKDFQTCLKVITMLLLLTGDFINRVKTFLKECSPFHWEHDDYYQKHMAYLRQYPEKFNLSVSGMHSSLNYLPVYFGNVCLRLLPVLDLVVHRILELIKELSNFAKSLEKLFEHIGGLYKFHDYPVTYLYTTLHYYERLLSDKHAVKKMLVYTILGAKSEYYPLSSFFTSEFCKYLNSMDGGGFQLTLQHCNTLLNKLVEGLSGSLIFYDYNIDWRFFEFRSAATFTLFTVSVECLTIPAAGSTTGGLLLESLLARIMNAISTDEPNLWEWINSLAILLTNLPESFRLPLFDQVLHTLKNDFYLPSQFSVGNVHQIAGSKTGGLMGLLHAYWQHSNIGTLSAMPQWIRSQVRPIVQTENQFIYFCHLMGPLFQRVHNEKPRLLVELVMEIYSILQIIDQHNPYMTHTDLICDLLYHIKYAYMGDVNKDEIEKIVSKLHSTLQTRLRFLASGSSEHPSAVHLPTSMGLVNQQQNLNVV